MQKLNVLYFAHVREVTGIGQETLEVPPEAPVSLVLDMLCSKYERLRPLLGRCRVALNDAFVTEDVATGPGDELVLIPPVAGGSDAPSASPIGALPPVHVGPEPLDGAMREALEALVTSPAHGALVTFVGQVRDHARGKSVVRLEYEAYIPMAEKQLAAIIAATEAAYPGVRAVVHHRVGVLDIGDTAVIVCVGSAHRQAAFAACQMVIDRLKQDVPIWKRESSPDGAVWIDDRP
jgi:molybdopterin converting factor subunit 1